MNNLQRINPNIELPYTFKSFTDTELFDELQKSLTTSYSHLARAAAIFNELKQRNIETPKLAPSLLNVFFYINSNKILPELASRYLGSTTLINYIANSIPITAQENLLQNDQIEFVTCKMVQDKPVFVTETVKLESIRNNMLCRVFGENGFRTIDEQKEFALSEIERKAKIAIPISSKKNKAITILGIQDLELRGHRLQLQNVGIDLNILFEFLSQNGFETKLKRGEF